MIGNWINHSCYSREKGQLPILARKLKIRRNNFKRIGWNRSKKNARYTAAVEQRGGDDSGHACMHGMKGNNSDRVKEGRS